MPLDLKDAYFSIPVAPHHRRFRDSHSKGWLINTRSCPLGCPWLPALLHDAWMRLSPLCNRWESTYSTTSTTGSFWPSRRRFFDIPQDPPPQPLRLPGAQGQLCQENTVTQPTILVPGHSYRVQMTATVSVEWAMTIQRHAASFKEGTARPLKTFQRMLGLMAATSPVLQLGLLHMQPI